MRKDNNQTMCVGPAKEFNGLFRISQSKPETQRAILCAALANGTSVINNDLRCLETSLMKDAVRAIGAVIHEEPTRLIINGVGNKPLFNSNSIECRGSALIFRIFSALCGLSDRPITLNTDETLPLRPMQPLFESLNYLGAKFDFIKDKYAAPCTVIPANLSGGICRLPHDISSQYITALLFLGPLLEQDLTILCGNKPYSMSYINQTIHALGVAGVDIDYNMKNHSFHTKPSIFKPFNTTISCDFTSASYLFACSILFKGKTIFHDVDQNSMQGEIIIMNLLDMLSLPYEYDAQQKKLTINNPGHCLRGDYTINVENGPNITPTLAVIGAFIEGSFTVTGAKVCQHHKCNRIATMVSELTKMDVCIHEIYDGNNICDGFTIKGCQSYTGNVNFESHHDHRILMSLYIAAMKADNACTIHTTSTSSVEHSFPDFFAAVKSAATHDITTGVDA